MTLDPAILPGLRPRMMSVAYRMLGSVTDAEDAVQDAFVRFHPAEALPSPEAFLIRRSTRACIGRVRGARRRKEYGGPRVPEPVHTRTGARDDALAESLTPSWRPAGRATCERSRRCSPRTWRSTPTAAGRSRRRGRSS